VRFNQVIAVAREIGGSANQHSMNTRMIKAALILVVLVFVTGCKVRTHPAAARNACIANLKQIDGSKAQWALDNHITNLEVTPLASQLYGPTNYIREVPECPQGGTYRIGALREHVQCTLAGHTL
jgi:hypothetical protein